MWWRLIFKEILNRKWGFLFSIGAVAVAVAAWVLVESGTASLKAKVGDLKSQADALTTQADRLSAEADRMEAQTKRITAGMAQNLLIVPAAVPEERYYRGDFGEESLPDWIVGAMLDPDVVLLVDFRTESQRKGEPAIRLADRKAVDAARLPKYILRYDLKDLADHYTAELQANAVAQAGPLKMDVFLTGQKREEGNKRSTPLVVPAQPGKAHVGSAVAGRLKLKVGDTVQVAGRSFTVDRVEPEQAGPDDIRVYVALADAQAIAHKPGRVNRVIALSCQCKGVTIERLAEVLDLYVRDWSGKYRARVVSTQPEAGAGSPAGVIAEPLAVRVTRMTRMAVARDSMRDAVEAQRLSIERQRESVAGQWRSIQGLHDTIKNAAAVLMPVLGAIIAVLIGGYFYFNVRERQQEIGVLLAVGYTPGPIIGALLFKLAAVSLAGGAIGAFGGIVLASQFGRALNLQQVVLPWYLWPTALAGALVLTLLAGIYPLLLAGRVRAADILRNA